MQLEFFSGPGHDALLDLHAQGSLASLNWSTKDGPLKEQWEGLITFATKEKLPNHDWISDVARSLVVRKQSDVISQDEMLKRLQQAQERTRQK